MLQSLRTHWRSYLLSFGLLAMAAGCAGHYFVQREPWRKEAEIACLKSGSVKESQVVVRVEPINGPGMCGADFPMKVTALGDSPLMGYSGDPRPPGEVPGAAPQRWPVTTPSRAESRQEPRYDPQVETRGEQRFSNPMRAAPAQPAYRAPAYPAGDEPMSISPSGQRRYDSAVTRETLSDNGETPSVRQPAAPSAARRRSVFDTPREPGDDEDEFAAQPQGSRRAPPSPTRPQIDRPVSVPLGSRTQGIAAVGPVEIKPVATLACPIVSALDRWITDAIQPAARRWFNQPVTEIRQISAYSCRGMNGQQGARISEHAFGNALDIASFVLADGRKITVKNGWKGSPEEQGFLRDVQGAACDQFNTVLAPGSNRFHYDHIHVDLMRRGSGYKICNPDAVPGEEVAARAAKQQGVAFRGDSFPTGSIKPARKSAERKSKSRSSFADEDDWVEDDGPRPAH